MMSSKMKLALYLPNFRDSVTVKELEDLTQAAEDHNFDSVWTLDRVVVPEAADQGKMTYPFGMMEQFPLQMPVSARGQWLHGMPLIPWLAAKTKKVRIGMSIIDTPYRAPGVLAGEIATVDHLSNGRVNVGVGSGWMPEEFAAASASHIFPKRHKHVRETIEILQGIWTNDLFEYHGEFADFDVCGFGAKPLQKPGPPIYFSGLKDPKRSASRIAKYGLSGWIGIQDSPEDIAHWRKEIQRELEELGSDRNLNDGFDMCSMIWFTITDEPTDQTPNRKLSNYLVGTADQITENLISYKKAGMTMPLIWPPFSGVPVSKTLEDLNQLVEEIMPKVNAS
jgi:alkanesulfonate monooxygenase SsuD/methylene tetrahydromethanopterin reductase-like flavin-dependent oxidoreductase (luciferase family)